MSNLPLLLADTRVNSDRREVALSKEFVELGGTDGASNKDDDLIELEIIQQLVQLAVLLLLLQFNVVLLETVESELGVLVDIVLSGVLHELSADGLDLLREGGGEHHNLLLLGSSTENVLDIGTHV